MSYFPEDIPFMSKEELRKNGIRIPKDATDKNVGTTDARQDFMDIVYAELASDPDNNRANRIIWAADGYADRRVDDALQVIKEQQSVKVGTDLAEVGTRTVRGYPIDADALMEKVAEEYGERARDTLYRIIRDMPPAEPKRMRATWISKVALQDGQITLMDYKCSNCSHHRGKPMNFCEVCGAKMER